MNYALNAWEKAENPIGINGFSFIELVTKNPYYLTIVLERFGFRCKAQDSSQSISLYVQGDINLIVNNKADSYAAKLKTRHGASVSAMGWRVRDAEFALQETVRRGAKAIDNTAEIFDLPAIYGVGDTPIYFVDDEGAEKLYNQMFIANPDYVENTAAKLQFIDHVDHDVRAGRMEFWTEFYEKIFNFTQVNYFDIKATVTGFATKALASPCGKMAIPIVKSVKGRSCVDEYLEKVQREGVQHIAFHAANLCDAVEYMRSQGQQFLPIPDQYYKTVNDRVPGHEEDVERLKKNKILIDGNELGYLLQIFTIKEPELDPFFFEFITRKSYLGFGEGNVKALLEGVEAEQFRSGYLKVEMPV